MDKKKIGFIGTDGRSLLAALEMRSKSDVYEGEYEGVVVRGTPAMLPMAQGMNWPISFISVKDNSVDEYAAALISAFDKNELDLAMVMPEALSFNGLVDKLIQAGHGDRIIGLRSKAALIEGDKIWCKKLCAEAGIPVADRWTEVDAKNFSEILRVCLEYIHDYGGVVLKYPFSAGGKGARIILNTWEIKDAYDQLMKDYKKDYADMFGKKEHWPLLIESRMSGAEISFTIFVDWKGNFQVLPTAMDYPERFPGPPGIDNPITGGMGAVSPHPLESPELIAMAGKTIAEPLIRIMKEKSLLRPCVLYPGCFVSFGIELKPRAVRVCEINIRPGEPEFQPVVKRVRNLGHMMRAMSDGVLDEVKPEVRSDQVSICMALVTGPGGPDKQKGYPWSYTKGEDLEIDLGYLDKKKITLIPSAMDHSENEKKFKTDGSRVCYLVANATVKHGQKRSESANILRQRMLNAFDAGKVRAVPRENPDGNRLDLRRDVGSEYEKAEVMRS